MRMKGIPQAVALSALAAAALAAGLALADEPNAEDEPLSIGTPTPLIDGVTSDGTKYQISRVSPEEISRLDPDVVDVRNLICLHVSAGGMGAGGCFSAPAKDAVFAPTVKQLEGNLFVLAVGDDRVAGIRAHVDGRGTAADSASLDLGEGLTLHYLTATTPEIVETAPDGTPAFPEVVVNAIDSAGRTVASEEFPGTL